MFTRIPTLAALLVCAASLVPGQANQGVGFLFQLPGAGDSGGRFVAYRGENNPLVADVDVTGPNGSYEILATPDGNRFYILNGGPIQAADANLSNLQVLNGITGTVRQATVTPDGKFLLAATSDGFFILRTENNTLIPTSSLNLAGSVVGVASSRDSKRAWIVTEAGFTGTIMAIDLVNVIRIGAPQTLPNRGQRLYRAPSGMLYVTASGRVMEINPATLQMTQNGDMRFNGDPGVLTFTPSGRYIYFVGLPPLLIQRSIFRIDLETKSVTEWPPFTFGGTDRVFEKIVVAGEDRIFLHSREEKRLYDVSTGQFGATPTSLATLFPNSQVIGVAVSNEVPSSRFLFVLIANGNQTNLHRIDLASNTTSAQIVASTNSGTLQFVQIPATTGAANFLRFNNNQVLNPGAVAQPLIVRVLDGVGKPVYNQNVLFSITTPGVTFGTPEVITDSEGYAQTTVTLPEEPGVYEIQVNAGSASTSFTLTIPTPGGGNPGGPQLISIVNGNGQLIEEFRPSALQQDLIVKVVKPDGTPHPGVAVKFEVVEGVAELNGSGDTATDTEGIAYGGFRSGSIGFGTGFRVSTIRATAAGVGSVDFKVTTFKRNPDGQTGLPSIIPNNSIVNIGQGDILPDAFTVQINSGNILDNSAPMPFIGLRIASFSDPTQPGPAVCVGDTLSDNLGVARCDLQAACTIGEEVGRLIVGESQSLDVRFRIGPGSPVKLNIISGNNQSGFAGTTLGQLLQARVTDNCGIGRQGGQVTFTVIQGSATLSSVQGTSDANGRVSAALNLGTTPGPVQVRLTMPNAVPIIFDATIQVVVGGLNIVSGNNQSALVNQAFAEPLVFRVRDNNNNPIPGVVVNFSLSGSANLGATQATTNAQGQVQVNVIGGNVAGAVAVTATYLNLSAVANLTVRPLGPQITSTSFYNSASFAQGLVPCGLVTVFGNGLASHLSSGQVVSGGAGVLPTTLSNVSLTVNGVAAPIQVVANNANGQQQVTFQVPCQTSVGNATVVVTANGASTTVNSVPVFQAQPGIFTLPPVGGKVYGAVIRVRDGSLITASNPMRTGEKYILLVGGLGQASPTINTNTLGTANQRVNVPIIVGVSNAGVPVDKSEYKVGTLGVYEVTFEVPLNAPIGSDQPLAIAAVVNNQIVFGNSVLVPLVIRGE